MAKRRETSTERRVAIVAGLRTPFVKSNGLFAPLSALDLATALVSELLASIPLDPAQLDRIVFGQVVVDPTVPNIAREIGLACDLPCSVDAYSVARACATGSQAIVDGAYAILTGEAEVVLCGGVDALSVPPITYQAPVVRALMGAQAARTPLAKLRAFAGLRPRDLLPRPPALRELSTGLTMGESAEKMAQENGITRAEQDAFACRSHQRAAQAWEQGIFAAEVISVAVPGGPQSVVSRDGMVRADPSEEKLAQLKPVFDRRYGSVTAGNSSPLTDGAAALVLMEASRAEALGFAPIAYLGSWAFAAVDPAAQLLAAPALAIPRALARAGRSLADMDLVDMHEAFAAQVLSNLQALSSADWQRMHGGSDGAVGTIDRDRLNIYGGSLSIGHPFAATAVRQVITMARELERRGSGQALISQCAAGGLGAALTLER